MTGRTGRLRAGNSRLAVRGLGLAAVVLGTYGCSGSPITPTRIEAALASTFANLVRAQVSALGLPPAAVADLVVTARCRKPIGGTDTGSGEWTCAVMWKGGDRRALGDTYELFVTTEGCYTATVASENLGGPTVRAPDGREVRNLLYAFEGCFDLL